MKRRTFLKSVAASPILFSILGEKSEAQQISQNAQQFVASINASGKIIRQKYSGQSAESFSKMRNSCGITSLLAIYNYFDYKNHGSLASFAESTEKFENGVFRLYEFLNKDPRSYYQSVQDLKNISINRWGWSTSIVKGGQAPYNFSDLSGSILNGYSVITLMKANSHPNLYNVDHFIVPIIPGEEVVYFDPWDGNFKKMTKSEFETSWVNTRIALVSMK